jgi:hypothetical protein
MLCAKRLWKNTIIWHLLAIILAAIGSARALDQPVTNDMVFRIGASGAFAPFTKQVRLQPRELMIQGEPTLCCWCLDHARTQACMLLWLDSYQACMTGC